MTEIDPKTTKRAMAFEMWRQAPMPMVTFFKTLNVTHLVKMSCRKGLKFNMLMCYCIGRAASSVTEFYMLSVDDKLMQYDRLAVNVIVRNKNGSINSCDIPFTDDLQQFNSDYVRLCSQVYETCENYDISDCMVVGTSALSEYEIDGAVNMYSGVFNNPFLFWSRYKRGIFKTTLTVSFQFHHVQMDGVEAAYFLDALQKQIKNLTI